MASAVKFHDIPYSLSPDILYTSEGVFAVAGLDHGRALRQQIELTDEGVSVEDEDALVDPDEPDQLGGQRSRDLPAVPPELELSALFKAIHLGSVGILPRLGVRHIGAQAGLP